MTELEFENKLIEQLSTGIVINAAKSNQIGDTIDAYGNMKVYKSKLWKYEPTIKTTGGSLGEFPQDFISIKSKSINTTIK